MTNKTPLQTRPAHSEYWLGKNWLKTMPKSTSPEFAMRMASVRRSIADFVKIICKKPIPVKFSSGTQSYTDGNSVVVISVKTDPNDIDVMVGLALHEASHVLLSQPLFKWMNNIWRITSAIRRRIISISGVHQPELVRKTIQLLINFLEDRRIDSWIYERIGGYRPYYDELYNTYFYSDEINTELAEPDSRIPTISNYELHIFNMTNKNVEVSALPELDKIFELIDLKNIRRFDDFDGDNSSGYPLIVETALQIAEIIFRHSVADASQNNTSKNKNTSEDESGGSAGASGNSPDNDLENLDTSIGDNETSNKPVPNQDSSALAQQKKFIMGEPMTHAPTNPELEAMISHVEETNATVATVSSDKSEARIRPIKAIIYRKVNENTVKSGLFPFGSLVPIHTSAVNEGIQMGNILAHRLRIMHDEHTMKFGRQMHGKLDKRQIHSLGFGNESVFTIDHIVRMKPVFVHLTLDSSGSMSGIRWHNALKLATALATAASKIRSFDISISMRSGTNVLSNSSESVAVALVYDSRVDSPSKIRQVFPYLVVNGSTPEGLAFDSIIDELVANQRDATRKFFVNISDGEPAMQGYYGEAAAHHTRNIINKIRKSGVRILSYFVGSSYSPDMFRIMYGADAAFIQSDSIGDIARTLNRLFYDDTESGVYGA